MKPIAARIVQIGFTVLLVLGGSQAAPYGEQKLSGEPKAPLSFTIHSETTHQTMIGFGAGFNENAEELMETILSPRERGKAYDLLYGEPGTRLNIVRLVVSPKAEALLPSGGHVRYDWAHDAGTQSEWAAIQPILKLTRAVLYAVPFTPPARWKIGAKLKDPLSGGSLNPDDYQAYAEYLADFLEYYHNVLHVDIDVLSVQNEPGVPAAWHSCVWTGEQLRDFLKVLAPVVRARGLNTKFMLSEGTNWTGAWAHLLPTLKDDDARGALGMMASHSYDAPDDPARARFADASARNGLPVWMSEMSLMQPPQPDDPGMNAALKIAGYIHRDLTEAHASAWIYCFAIFTSSFRGSMGVLSPADGAAHGTLVVPKRFWAMANYSHFVRPGWELIDVGGAGLDNTAFVSPDGASFVIVAVNAGKNPQPVNYDFAGRTIGAVAAFATTVDTDLTAAAPPTTQLHGFGAMLAPASVTTFVGTLAP